MKKKNNVSPYVISVFFQHLLGCIGALNWASSAAKNDYDLFSFIFI